MRLDDLPDALRPDRHLADVAHAPTEWVAVDVQERTSAHNGGITSHMVAIDDVESALASVSWHGRSLGTSGAWRYDDECQFAEGLKVDENPAAYHFVSQAGHHGLAPPTRYFTPSFLWFFEAIPRQDGSWFFLSPAGHDVELVRSSGAGANRRVEVSALPLRRYLTARRMALIIQRDFVQFTDEQVDEPIQFEIKTDLAHFAYNARSADLHDEHPSFYRLLGKHAVLPLDVDVCADSDFDAEDPPYPEYIYAVDPETGALLSWTCREDDLTNYFVDRSAPHYLTPVYFRREVLARYASQPGRYTVSKRELACLVLWSLRLDINSEGLVEVYLGDLGKYLPAEERDYWRSFNVAPRGGMNESRFRNDFLAEWTQLDDPLLILFRARSRLASAFQARFGRPLYLDLAPEDRVIWEGMHLMSTDEDAERDALTTILAKGLVDSLDVHALREATGELGDASLNLLTQLAQSLGAEAEAAVEPLRVIQGMRSTGSSHVRGDNYRKLLKRTGFDDLRPSQQFEAMVRHAGSALDALAAAIEDGIEQQ